MERGGRVLREMLRLSFGLRHQRRNDRMRRGGDRLQRGEHLRGERHHPADQHIGDAGPNGPVDHRIGESCQGVLIIDRSL